TLPVALLLDGGTLRRQSVDALVRHREVAREPVHLRLQLRAVGGERLDGGDGALDAGGRPVMNEHTTERRQRLFHVGAVRGGVVRASSAVALLLVGTHVTERLVADLQRLKRAGT